MRAAAAVAAVALIAASGADGGPAAAGQSVAPTRIAPIVAGRASDGIWRRAEPWAGAPPPLMVTSFAFDRAAGDVAYAAWIRAARTQLALYPGYKGPGPTSLPRGPEQVPPSARGRLVATFNSGFYEADGPAGFFVHGLLYHAMLPGLATVVARRDGSVDVVRWTDGRRPPPGVLMARQNLAPIVEGGRVAAGVEIGSRWGVTLHGAPRVWRSALGVDRGGNLIYLAAPNQTAATLARLMVRSGAVRAMQLDINPEWPILVTYGGPGARNPSLFVPNPNQIADRFLSPSTKDFFAVYLRHAGAAVGPQPY